MLKAERGVLSVMLVPIVAALVQGIVLASLESFLKSPKGASYMSKECVFINMSPSDLCFVPLGWMPMICFFGAASDAKYGHMTHIPVYIKSFIQTVPTQAVSAIKVYNMRFFLMRRTAPFGTAAKKPLKSIWIDIGLALVLVCLSLYFWG